MSSKKRIVVGITGASGAIYGVRLLQELKARDVETHLVVTNAGADTLHMETGMTLQQVRAIASKWYENDDLAAPLASGTILRDGMVVAPCSIKTLSALANSFSNNLLLRAGDVTLKERKPLILMVREAPFHAGHLEMMHRLALMGAIIMPPIPVFYHRPTTIDDIVNQTVGRVMHLLGIETDLVIPWQG